MKLTFLVGSGISRAARMPSIEEITGAILRGEGLKGQKRLNVLAFLRWLRAQAQARHIERPINYEDLAYLAGPNRR
jgi:hypothetical protein